MNQTTTLHAEVTQWLERALGPKHGSADVAFLGR